ncbi:MAG: dipeptide ABC transporter ATP-binding protein [Devosia sp.]
MSASPNPADDDLLTVRDLKTWFPVRSGAVGQTLDWIRAVDGVSFSIRKSETLGLVGESGCGKSTLGRSILRLETPREGEILFEGEDLLAARADRLRALRRNIQMIFQDPMSSLDPRMRVRDIIAEGLAVRRVARAERDARVRELIDLVGLSPHHLDQYPHEFSGGQRQRIGIARALALRPKLIVADEPVSALDVSVQAQVLNLLSDLQDAFGLTYLFISHDLAVIEYLADRVGVMYLGKLVELAPSEAFFAQPRMPYSQALLSAIPGSEERESTSRIILEGELPSPMDPPSGCRFRTRCWKAKDICAREEPPLREVAPSHFAACHFAIEDGARPAS